MLVEARLEPELETELELVDAGPACEQFDVADVRERVDTRFGIVELLCQLECASPPLDRLLGVLEVHVEVRKVAVGHRKLVSRLEGPEDRERLVPDLHRRLDSADVPEQS